MASDIPEMNEVLRTLKEGKTATPVTIRDFLSWFGAQRRTSANVEYINRQLKKVGIRTVPDYLNIWVYTPITFELAAKHPAGAQSGTKESDGGNAGSQGTKAEGDDPSAGDPSYRIGRIASASNKPVSVKPNATLLEATTLMLSRNFSQLPVMTTDREVKGVISWESIGTRSATGVSGPDVQSFMDEHHEIPATASLFVAIRTIVEHNYVLIRSLDRTISGIVTATDIALQFEEISTPFLLLAEIENSIRMLIASKLNIADVKESCSPEHLPAEFTKISELNFGNYVRILEHPSSWDKIGLRIDRVTFCSELADINTIRNDVMHFDPDPITDQDIAKLRNTAKMLDRLRSIGAF